MPRIPSSKRNRKPPEGYERIEPTLKKLLAKLKDAQSTSMTTEDKRSSLWPIIRLNHQINKYIYSLYFERKQISEELYNWLLMQKYANPDLIAKWKKKGYEKLCCLNCIMSKETNHQTTCICRVPKKTLVEKGDDDRIECITCGCRGCASTD